MSAFIDHDEYIKLLKDRREVIDLAKRPRRKKTRLVIDNEYIDDGHMAALPNSVTLVYCVLAKYAHVDRQTCFPSIATIMKKTGIGSDRTVYAAIRKLEARFIIEISRSRGRSSNRYKLLNTTLWTNPVITAPQPPQKMPITPGDSAPQSQNI